MINTNKTFLGICSILLAIAGFSCSEDKIPETNNTSFIIVEQDSIYMEISEETIVNLPVLVCGSPHKTEIVVYFDLYADSLTNNLDYKLLNSSKTLTYPIDIYNDTIHLALSPDNLDENNIKLLTIEITSTNSDYNLGYPGPDHLNVNTRIYLSK